MSPCYTVSGLRLIHTSPNEQWSTDQMLQFSFPDKWINEILWFFMTFPIFNDFFINLWPKSKFHDFLKFYDPCEACKSHLSWKCYWNSSSRSEDMKIFSVNINYFHQFFSHFLVTKKLITSTYNKWFQNFFIINLLVIGCLTII